jgi:hypothetical protein
MPGGKGGKPSPNGFELDQANWNGSYQRLLRFRIKEGHCRVPQHYAADPALGRWVATQRAQKANGTLLQERYDLLADIEFVWGKNIHATWDVMYQQLIQYYQTHGHCNVTTQFLRLNRWVHEQRRSLRKDTPRHAARRQKLDELNFDWTVKKEQQALASSGHTSGPTHGGKSLPSSTAGNANMATGHDELESEDDDDDSGYDSDDVVSTGDKLAAKGVVGGGVVDAHENSQVTKESALLPNSVPNNASGPPQHFAPAAPVGVAAPSVHSKQLVDEAKRGVKLDWELMSLKPNEEKRLKFLRAVNDLKERYRDELVDLAYQQGTARNAWSQQAAFLKR